MGMEYVRQYKDMRAGSASGGSSVMEADFESRTIHGYFACWTTDQVGDRIVPGSFRKTFAERGPRRHSDGSYTSMIKLGFNHPGLSHNSKVIGIPIRLFEDSVGAGFEARVDATPFGDEILERIRSRSLDTCSFAFDILQWEPIKDASPEALPGGKIITPKRLLKELRVYEIGPVDFACNESTTIMLGSPPEDPSKAVQRSGDNLLRSLERLERTLDGIATGLPSSASASRYEQHREALGLHKAGGWDRWDRDSASDGAGGELLSAMRKLRTTVDDANRDARLRRLRGY